MATELALQTAHTAAWKAINAGNPPDETETARRNLLNELKAIGSRGRNNQGFYEIYDRTLADLVDLLEASKPIHIDAAALVAELFADGWIHAGTLAPLITAELADPNRNDHVCDIVPDELVVTHHPITERFNIGLCPFGRLPDSAFTGCEWPDTPGRYRLTTDGTNIRFEPLT